MRLADSVLTYVLTRCSYTPTYVLPRKDSASGTILQIVQLHRYATTGKRLKAWTECGGMWNRISLVAIIIILCLGCGTETEKIDPKEVSKETSTSRTEGAKPKPADLRPDRYGVWAVGESGLTRLLPGPEPTFVKATSGNGDESLHSIIVFDKVVPNLGTMAEMPKLWINKFVEQEIELLYTRLDQPATQSRRTLADLWIAIDLDFNVDFQPVDNNSEMIRILPTGKFSQGGYSISHLGEMYLFAFGVSESAVQQANRIEQVLHTVDYGRLSLEDRGKVRISNWDSVEQENRYRNHSLFKSELLPSGVTQDVGEDAQRRSDAVRKVLVAKESGDWYRDDDPVKDPSGKYTAFARYAGDQDKPNRLVFLAKGTDERMAKPLEPFALLDAFPLVFYRSSLYLERYGELYKYDLSSSSLISVDRDVWYLGSSPDCSMLVYTKGYRSGGEFLRVRSLENGTDRMIAAEGGWDTWKYSDTKALLFVTEGYLGSAIWSWSEPLSLPVLLCETPLSITEAIQRIQDGKQPCSGGKSVEGNTKEPTDLSVAPMIFGRALHEENKKLEEDYSYIYDRLSEKQRSEFQRAQAAWATYSDAVIKFAERVVSTDKTDILRARAIQIVRRDRMGRLDATIASLRRDVFDMEGDLSPQMDVLRDSLDFANSQIQRLLTGFDDNCMWPDAQAEFEKAQRAWREYRDRSVDLEVSLWSDYELRNLASLSCQVFMTELRMLELNYLMQAFCLERDGQVVSTEMPPQEIPSSDKLRKARIKGDNVRVRAKPSLSGEILTQLNDGYEIEIDNSWSAGAEWIPVRFGTVGAFVHKDYLTLLTDK